MLKTFYEATFRVYTDHPLSGPNEFNDGAQAEVALAEVLDRTANEDEAVVVEYVGTEAKTGYPGASEHMREVGERLLEQRREAIKRNRSEEFLGRIASLLAETVPADVFEDVVPFYGVDVATFNERGREFPQVIVTFRELGMGEDENEAFAASGFNVDFQTDDANWTTTRVATNVTPDTVVLLVKALILTHFGRE